MTVSRIVLVLLALGLVAPESTIAPRQTGRAPLRVALVQQPFVPNGTSRGPEVMATGGIQAELAKLGGEVRVRQIGLTPEQEPEYGGWKRLGYALGHLGRAVAQNERDGFFSVGLLGTCPSMPGMVAGLQHSGPTLEPLRVGMLWLDAQPDFNTPETTRSG
jgi:arginase family enzyme